MFSIEKPEAPKEEEDGYEKQAIKTAGGSELSLGEKGFARRGQSLDTTEDEQRISDKAEARQKTWEERNAVWSSGVENGDSETEVDSGIDG